MSPNKRTCQKATTFDPEMLQRESKADVVTGRVVVYWSVFVNPALNIPCTGTSSVSSLYGELLLPYAIAQGVARAAHGDAVYLPRPSANYIS